MENTRRFVNPCRIFRSYQNKKVHETVRDKYSMQSNDDDVGDAIAGDFNESNDIDDSKPPGN